MVGEFQICRQLFDSATHRVRDTDLFLVDRRQIYELNGFVTVQQAHHEQVGRHTLGRCCALWLPDGTASCSADAIPPFSRVWCKGGARAHAMFCAPSLGALQRSEVCCEPRS